MTISRRTPNLRSGPRILLPSLYHITTFPNDSPFKQHCGIITANGKTEKEMLGTATTTDQGTPETGTLIFMRKKSKGNSDAERFAEHEENELRRRDLDTVGQMSCISQSKSISQEIC